MLPNTLKVRKMEQQSSSNYTDLVSIAQPSSTSIELPTNNDVRLEQGKGFECTEGNMMYRYAIDARKIRYRNAMIRKNGRGKNTIIQEIVHDLRVRNSRVFHRAGGENQWEQDVKLTTTIADALRAATRAKRNKPSRKKSSASEKLYLEESRDDDFDSLLASIGNGDEEQATTIKHSNEDIRQPLFMLSRTPYASCPSTLELHQVNTHQHDPTASLKPPPSLPSHLADIAESYFRSGTIKIQEKLLQQTNDRVTKKHKRLRALGQAI